MMWEQTICLIRGEMSLKGILRFNQDRKDHLMLNLLHRYSLIISSLPRES